MRNPVRAWREAAPERAAERATRNMMEEFWAQQAAHQDPEIEDPGPEADPPCLVESAEPEPEAEP